MYFQFKGMALNGLLLFLLLIKQPFSKYIFDLAGGIPSRGTRWPLYYTLLGLEISTIDQWEGQQMAAGGSQPGKAGWLAGHTVLFWIQLAVFCLHCKCLGLDYNDVQLSTRQLISGMASKFFLNFFLVGQHSQIGLQC